MGKLLKKLVLYLIINRLLLFLCVYLIAVSFPFHGSTPFQSFFEFLLAFGKRWDGNSYTFIATHGYTTSGSEKYFIVFPPLYPLVIKLLSVFGINPVLSGIIISNSFFIASMVILFKLIISDYNQKFALLTIAIISIFPTTFFFSVAYPESLFVFLFAFSFFLLRKKSYAFSGLSAGLATITRPFGIAILPALLLQTYFEKKSWIKNFLIVVASFLIPVVFYLSINYFVFGSPLAFLDALKQNWQKSFAYPWQGILESWKRGFFTTEMNNYKFLVGYGEAIASTLAWISVAFGIKHWGLKSPYLLYLILGTLLFTSTGFILSGPRYLLSIPPFFILFAKFLEKNKFIKYGWMILSVILLVYTSYQFAWGQWTF